MGHTNKYIRGWPQKPLQRHECSGVTPAGKRCGWAASFRLGELWYCLTHYRVASRERPQAGV